MAALVERATSSLLTGPDWGLNLEICDALNQNPSQSRDVLKALRKRLGNKDTKVQMLALTVLEMLMKNCGDPVHQVVAEKGILSDMTKVVKKKSDMGVKEKVLALIDSWQKAFGGSSSRYLQYHAVYDELRRSGIVFPKQSVPNTVCMISVTATTQNPRIAPAPPAATQATIATAHTTRSLPQLGYGLPGAFPPVRLDEVLAASENFVWSAKDLDGARRGLDVLNEMLNALDPKDKQAAKDDVIMHLVEQCVTNQKIIRQLVNSTSDEQLLCQGLALNDELQLALDKHNGILSGSSTMAEPIPAVLRGGLNVYDEEDDGAEEELFDLARRSSLRTNCLPANGQVNGTVGGRTEYDTHGQVNGTVGGRTGYDTHSLPNSNGTLLVLPQESGTWNLHANKGSLPQHVSNPVLDDSKPSLYVPVIPPDYHQGSSPSNSNGYTSSWVSSYSAESPQSPPQPGQLVSPRHDTGSVLDNPAPALSSPSLAVTGKAVSSLPPPPILYTERERFFEERRQMNRSPKASSVTPTGVEQRVKNLNLSSASEEGGAWNVQAKQASSTDRLFEDLVDLKSMRSDTKKGGAPIYLSRPKAS